MKRSFFSAQAEVLLKNAASFFVYVWLIFIQYKHKIAIFGHFGPFSRFSAWGCCLASAKFLTNFSLVLLTKVLLIKKRVPMYTHSSTKGLCPSIKKP